MNNLNEIYQALSNGELSQQEALIKIKAIKQNSKASVFSSVLAKIEWVKTTNLSVKETKNDDSEYHIVLCDLPNFNIQELNRIIPSSSCEQILTKNKNLAEIYLEISQSVFKKIQSILKRKPQNRINIQLVIGNNPQGTILSGLSGLLKTAALENLHIEGQIIAVDTTSVEVLAKRLIIEKTNWDNSLIKYDSACRYVKACQEVNLLAINGSRLFEGHSPYKESGVYLITGGLGALGQLFAKDILAKTAKSTVILTGRSKYSAEIGATIQQMSQSVINKNRVEYRELDITSFKQVETLVARITKDHQQLNGIIHSAGMNSDNFIIKKSSKEFVDVLTPKVSGTYYLDLASNHIELDFFVLFSSVASWFGNLGQADYSTANGFMDEFAFYRNQLVTENERHGITLSINWPLWQEGGMKIETTASESLQRTMGVKPMQNESGMQAFYQSLVIHPSQMIVMEGELSKIRHSLVAKQLNSNKSLLERQTEVLINTKPRNTQQTTLNQDRSDTASILLEELTQEHLCKQLSTFLKLPVHKIDPRAQLEKYGIDSIMAINLTNQLEKDLGSLPKTLFFEYQTIAELAKYFIKTFTSKLNEMFELENSGSCDKIVSNAKSESINTSNNRVERPYVNADVGLKRKNGINVITPQTKTSRVSMQQKEKEDSIAIVGLSGRYPEARDLEQFWNNLSEGKDCIVEVPESRWDWKEFYTEDRSQQGKHFSKWGGFIEGVDQFDPLFFNISPKEAKTIDPQERLFLQHAWNAVEDSGFTHNSLQIPHSDDASGQVGVYVGVMYGEYNLSGSLASIANRVSYFLNLHGPSITLDTMCSSSLTAIHLACQDLKQGRTDLAIAGGVNISVHPGKYLMLSDAQFISSSGNCQSFGEGGDGYIPGEGVGVVILQRLSDAVAENRHIYGVIKGSGINHGGKTNGFSVPNPKAQSNAIGRAIREANINPRHISYIEAHGTGTKLGDPIEIAALTKAFTVRLEGDSNQIDVGNNGFCLLGSAKSNIGHCESAAGIAGLTKVLLQMKHKKVVPSLHSEKLNQHIDFDTTPFIVNQELKEWHRPVINGHAQPRIAGISSFGAGGSNAHLIVEEFVNTFADEKNTSMSNFKKSYIVPLSAKNPRQLELKAIQLRDYLKGNIADLRIDSVAYTLQVGRESMNERIGILTNSVEQLIEKLDGIIAKSDSLDNVFLGQARTHGDTLSIFSVDADLRLTVDKWFSTGQYRKLLELWCKGLDVDWSKLYANQRPLFVSLPTYPFSKGKYWLEPAEAPYNPLSLARQSAIIHPLIHRNISNFEQVSFITEFSGKELFLEKNLDNIKVLPKAIYLEMLEVLFGQVLSANETPQAVELVDIIWGEDASISEKRSVSIVLFEQGKSRVDFEFFTKTHVTDDVLCQGRANLVADEDIESINLDKLKSKMKPIDSLIEADSLVSLYITERKVLAEIQLAKTNESTASMINFRIIDWALMSSLRLLNQSYVGRSMSVDSIDSFRVLEQCEETMFALISYSNTTPSDKEQISVDVQLINHSSEICVQMKGVCLSPVVSEKSSVIIKESMAKHSEQAFVHDANNQATETGLSSNTNPIKILLKNHSVAKHIAQTKPQGIALKQPLKLVNEVSERLTRNSDKPRVHLNVKDEAEFDNQTPSGCVNLYQLNDGVFSLQIDDALNKNKLSNNGISDFVNALDALERQQQVKVLLITGTQDEFIRGGREQINLAVNHGLLKAIASFPVPVIAVMQGNASGIGLLIGAISDFMICGEESHYQFTNYETSTYPTANEMALFEQRFGRVQSNHLLYLLNEFNGVQLRNSGWSCPIVDKQQVPVVAKYLAERLSSKPERALSLLKSHLASDMNKIAESLSEMDEVNSSRPTPLSGTSVKKLAMSAPLLSLDTSTDGILIVEIKRAKKQLTITELVNDFTRVLINKKTSLKPKVVILRSNNTEFLPLKSVNSKSDEVEQLLQCVLSFEVPVIVAFENNANGLAWWVAQFFSICVYSNKGSYSLAELLSSDSMMLQASYAFECNFGSMATKRILFEAKKYTGEALKKLQPTSLVVDKQQVVKRALEVALMWTKIPDTSYLNQLQQHSKELSKFNIEPIDEVTSEYKGIQIEQDESVPKTINLDSKVVSAKLYPDGVLLIAMEDQQAKNTFTDELVEGLTEVFGHVEHSSDCKVVVLTGYGNYFSSGGTKESLLAIQKGQIKFTETKAFHLAMDCRLPVISAFNGHAIGAGLTLGLFADIAIFSEESQFISPYMNYGFTPGAGATYILPKKLGFDVARESLFVADEILGTKLQKRLPSNLFASRRNIGNEALELASRVARASRASLVAVKRLWTKGSKSSLDNALREEVSMHQKTFVGQAETLKNINDNFMIEDQQPRLEGSSSGEAVKTSNKSEPRQIMNLSEVMEVIKQLLAEELHLVGEDFDENVQFIELGLDSITGVTWVKKINQRYQLSLDATKVYSYPTLQEFSRLVLKESEGQRSITSELITSVHENKPVEQGIKVSANSISDKISQQDSPSHSDVSNFLKDRLAQELHLEEIDIDEDAQFIDLGLDSITGVTLVRNINQIYDLSLEATKIYSYPTLAEFSSYLFNEIQRMAASSPIPTTDIDSSGQLFVDGGGSNTDSIDNKLTANQSNRSKLISLRTKKSRLVASNVGRRHDQPVAIIGMAGQFPQASNLDQYWKNISNGKNCISEVPLSRWDIDEIFQAGEPLAGKTNSKWIGALDEYDKFDPLFFTISPTEAETMDPQQRLFLQSCWHSIENAGYNAKELSGTKCGVFVGCAAGDYNLISREQQISAQGFTGGATSILAARISYFLNLQGPCISIDTACSSSLVAIANGCESLNSASSDLVLAGGVYVMSRSDMLIKTSQSGMLSTDGRCFSFDQRANGFVAGEGVGVVFLKRLADAEKDNDIIQGVIRGWGINQDGKTNGITAPNAESQARLEQDVYDNFQIDPADLQLIEAHGTGTKLGDPIEIEGLKNAFKKYTDNQNYCALGSVKSNIGHCLTAAGIAGVIKLILAFKHKQLPPTINYEKLNQHISLENSPFYISEKLKIWNVQEHKVRQAAISSFGFSGTNAHMVLAEYKAPNAINKQVANTSDNSLMAIPLSAKTQGRLKQKALDLVVFLQNTKTDLDLNELAFTLQTGREAMESRLVVIVSDIEELVEKLQLYVEDNSARITDLYTGQVKRNKEGLNIISQDTEVRDALISNWVAQRNLTKIVKVWTKGLAFDWAALYEKMKPKRMVLPNYPFEQERYWLETPQQEELVSSQDSVNRKMHPLLHKKKVDLGDQFKNSTLMGGNASVLAHQRTDVKPAEQLPQRITLPTYPFLRERCWVEGASEAFKEKPSLQSTGNFDSIREIFEQVDNGTIETDRAIKKLKELA
jgi:acyl transferase domain-containing protein/enoyl-CoA hydratase/carnithine racemase/acyl carrier protein/NAD(P)-dependent dehydrogenase (short-subunit alcohol dehydrogenase family)